jgi:hypothetical protein
LGVVAVGRVREDGANRVDDGRYIVAVEWWATFSSVAFEVRNDSGLRLRDLDAVGSLVGEQRYDHEWYAGAESSERRA